MSDSKTQERPSRIEIMRKGGWMPEELQAMVRNFNPRSDLGKLIKSILKYVPEEEARQELVAAAAGIITVESRLDAKVLRGQQIGDIHCLHRILYDGPDTARCTICGERYKVEDAGLLSERVITTAGVNYLAAQWAAANDTLTIRLFKYQGLGTGTTAEATSDTALVTELTTEYNPDNTRATGALTNPSANVIQCVATNTLDSGTPAITELGWFTQAATGGGTLWDRFKFSAINLTGANGDGLQGTTKATFSAGG